MSTPPPGTFVPVPMRLGAGLSNSSSVDDFGTIGNGVSVLLLTLLALSLIFNCVTAVVVYRRWKTCRECGIQPRQFGLRNGVPTRCFNCKKPRDVKYVWSGSVRHNLAPTSPPGGGRGLGQLTAESSLHARHSHIKTDALLAAAAPPQVNPTPPPLLVPPPHVVPHPVPSIPSPAAYPSSQRLAWKYCSTNGPTVGIRAESVLGVPAERVGHFLASVSVSAFGLMGFLPPGLEPPSGASDGGSDGESDGDAGHAGDGAGAAAGDGASQAPRGAEATRGGSPARSEHSASSMVEVVTVVAGGESSASSSAWEERAAPADWASDGAASAGEAAAAPASLLLQLYQQGGKKAETAGGGADPKPGQPTPQEGVTGGAPT